ncbi:hypothetical protein ABEB36_007858 [Hypothenemus hampei]|uniref:BLOC-1-related complex subunit 6 C-terminal helix domain-containing protein n=1 Tax=Hypothenemus hampei TaxID=57062 RepID=A0ABD1EVD7_HYPHA
MDSHQNSKYASRSLDHQSTSGTVQKTETKPLEMEENLELQEDDASQQMTQSYSEISFKSGLSPEDETHNSSLLELDSKELEDNFINNKRPLSLVTNKPLRPLNLDGTVHLEGKMMHFVAEDLETKIKLSSPVSRKGDSRSGTPVLRQTHLGHVDTAFINDLECEAHRMATSVDNLIENLSGILHSISSITADNVDVYKNSVSKMSDAMDGNIKSMYTMMAKAEEISQNMKIVEAQSAKIKEIRKLVDLFESFL